MGKIHHLSVGCGDAVIIQTDATFLIDCHRIDEYEHLLPNRLIRGVFITHQHEDHYSGLNYLRDNGYSIEYLIFSPYERRYADSSVTLEEWNEFANHCDYFKRNGTKLLRPYKQNSWEKPYWGTNGLRFWLLGPSEPIANSETRELHDACLVVKIHMGDRKCLITGDASDTNLQNVATINHICDDILRASHHGSIEGADLDFIKKCAASYTVISTESGVYDNVPHPTALQRYSENTKSTVYRTDKNGIISWDF